MTTKEIFNNPQPNKRWPAEWERHHRTWMAFPCRQEIWSNGLEKAQLAFSEVANIISEFEPLSMLVHPSHIGFAKKKLSSQITLIEFACDDSWTRDTAPIWIIEDGKRVALDFEFNAWGNKFSPYDNDQKIAPQIVENTYDVYQSIPMVLEGGAVHSNGAGKLLTTAECLLNQNRNPKLSQLEIEAKLKDTLGADEIIWLNRGVVGDVDTDGHIDNIACFVGENIVLSQTCSEESENFVIYNENRHIIRDHGIELVEIEEPEARYTEQLREPLSYINFYIANDLVVVPKFGCRQDAQAKATIAELFPSRKIIDVDANEILVGGGGIHCITMQQPEV